MTQAWRSVRADDAAELERKGVRIVSERERKQGWSLLALHILDRVMLGATERLTVAIVLEHPFAPNRMRMIVATCIPGRLPSVMELGAAEMRPMARSLRRSIEIAEQAGVLGRTGQR